MTRITERIDTGGNDFRISVVTDLDDEPTAIGILYELDGDDSGEMWLTPDEATNLRDALTRALDIASSDL